MFRKHGLHLTVSQIATGARARRRRSRAGLGRRIELAVGGALVLALLAGAVRLLLP